MIINYVFVRHGYACHNAMKSLAMKGKLTKQDLDFANSIMKDPELTEIGVDASIKNGCILKKVLNKFDKLTETSITVSDNILVGCSPLIRSMETAYYMTQKWTNPPNKIYVFPLLREIDERGKNKFSRESRKIIDTHPLYAMKSIKEQKEYLQSIGLLDKFDFSYIEGEYSLRSEPGDIKKFMDWFVAQVVPNYRIDQLNAFLVTHAGVLRDYTESTNNSGIVWHTELKNSMKVHKNMFELDQLLPSSFFKNYQEYVDGEYFCPSNRCNYYCKAKGMSSAKLKRIKIEDEEDNQTSASEKAMSILKNTKILPDNIFDNIKTIEISEGSSYHKIEIGYKNNTSARIAIIHGNSIPLLGKGLYKIDLFDLYGRQSAKELAPQIVNGLKELGKNV